MFKWFRKRKVEPEPQPVRRQVTLSPKLSNALADVDRLEREERFAEQVRQAAKRPAAPRRNTQRRESAELDDGVAIDPTSWDNYDLPSNGTNFGSSSSSSCDSGSSSYDSGSSGGSCDSGSSGGDGGGGGF